MPAADSSISTEKPDVHFGPHYVTGTVTADGKTWQVKGQGYHDHQTDKDYPKTSHYVFGDGDKTAVFDIEWSQVLEVRDMYGATSADHYGLAGAKQRQAYDAMGIRPSYMRYYANGTLTLTDGDQTVTESGNMIHEFNYSGIPDPRAHL